MPWPGQGFQHLNGDVDVVIDNRTLVGIQGATGNAQIVRFFCRKEITVLTTGIAPAI